MRLWSQYRQAWRLECRTLTHFTTCIDALPALKDGEGVNGVCYVLRGPSLGGKVFARHIERTLGLDAAQGAGFLNADTGDGLSWVQWMRCADEALLADNNIGAACSAAVDTFARLLQLFSASRAGPIHAAEPVR